MRTPTCSQSALCHEPTHHRPTSFRPPCDAGTHQSTMSKILGFGNPLLDISATVEQTVLDEWGASLNNAILAEEKHQPLCESAAAAASARVQRALSVAFRRAQTRS